MNEWITWDQIMGLLWGKSNDEFDSPGRRDGNAEECGGEGLMTKMVSGGGEGIRTREEEVKVNRKVKWVCMEGEPVEGN